MALALLRVVPEGAVTRSVDMTIVTGSERSGWNWISRVVIIPIRGELREPFSVQSKLLGSSSVIAAKSNVARFLIGLKIGSPQYDGIVLDERKLFVFV